MIILEEPFVSGLLLRFLHETQIPVLRNKYTDKTIQEQTNLNIIEESRFIAAYATSENPLLYTVSEYALDWVYRTLPDKKMIDRVSLLKDKVAFRKASANLHKDLFYAELHFNELRSVKIDKLPLPVVLKPAVGFLSASVYTIASPVDWAKALTDIGCNLAKHANAFPDTVVDNTRFIVESYISGKEYAIDLYFNDTEPVIINIFEHPFFSSNDVSDRLYYTSKSLFDNFLTVFTDYFKELNTVLHLKDIPVHVELRVDNGKIAPIEINPLRFAGLCLNEIHYHICGTHPLSYFFNKTIPDYQAMWKGNENRMFCFSVFEKDDNGMIDMKGIKTLFSSIIEMRIPNNPNLEIGAFVFSETEISNKNEIQNILYYNNHLINI